MVEVWRSSAKVRARLHCPRPWDDKALLYSAPRPSPASPDRKMLKYGWTSLFTDSVFANLPTCQNLLLTPTSTLLAFSQSFVDICRAEKKKSHLTCMLPAEVEQGDTRSSCLALTLQTGGLYEVCVVLHCLHFGVFCGRLRCFQWPPGTGLKC